MKLTESKKVGKKDEELRAILTLKMAREGWENPRQFHLGSGVASKFSIETTRRAFNPCDYKSMEPSTLLIILKYLNFSANEIRDILKNFTSDKEIWPLLGDGTTALTTQEEAMVEIFRMIRAAKPEMLPNIADNLDLMAMAAGIEFKALTNRLRVHITTKEA
jgi:hypothetical protein